MKHIADDGDTLYLEFPSGQTATASGASAFEAEVGMVVLVQAETNHLEPAPDELWPEDLWVGIVRLKLPDVTIIDTNGRWRPVRTRDNVSYGEGNTVEGSDSRGVSRVLSQDPLKYFDLPTVNDDFIAKTFKHEKGTGETFEDFGGLSEVVERAHELVEVPLREHKRLARIRARPVKGVLFTGPPGVGKTMLARIIANSTEAAFYEISGPEIFSKWYGQSEEILRRLFDQAATQERAIIFFDEIDSIAAHRSDEAHEASKRVVAQLLTLMDGFSADTNVVVIAATNRPQDIDVALRRPGRFDWEIEFPLPELRDRTEILEKAAQRLETSEHLPHAFVAARAGGWSGAELAAIWTEAALLAAMDERDVIMIEDYMGGFERVATQRRRQTAPSSSR